MTNPKFQVYKDRRGEYRFRLRARNGEIILHSSEGYSSKQGCLGGIQSVKDHSPYDRNYHRAQDRSGQYYFSLKATNGRTLGMSEAYTTKANRDAGIESVKRVAPTAPTEDLTLTTKSKY